MPDPRRRSDLPDRRVDPLAGLLQLPGVAESVGETRRAVDAVIGHRVLRQRSAEVSTESALRGAWASAVLDGSTATWEQVHESSQPLADAADHDAAGHDAAGHDGHGHDDHDLYDEDDAHDGDHDHTLDGPIMLPLPARAPVAGASLPDGARVTDDPILQGALRVSAALGPLADTWSRAPRQVLARLHVLAAADLVDPADAQQRLGRPQPGPAAGETAARLDALVTLLSPGGTAAPAGVLAAIVQGELLALQPFGTADGVVARAAARLTFVERGLDPKSLMALEVGQLELRDEFDEALEGYRGGTSAGVARWIVFCGRADVLGARETLAICEALQRG